MPKKKKTEHKLMEPPPDGILFRCFQPYCTCRRGGIGSVDRRLECHPMPDIPEIEGYNVSPGTKALVGKLILALREYNLPRPFIQVMWDNSVSMKLHSENCGATHEIEVNAGRNGGQYSFDVKWGWIESHGCTNSAERMAEEIEWYKYR